MSTTNSKKSDLLRKRIAEDFVFDDKTRLYILRHMAIYSITLPNLGFLDKELCQFVEKLLIDFDTLEELEHGKVLNWCRKTRKLVPLKTTGDGNCLLHALSRAMWGIQDDGMVLRRCLYTALVEDRNYSRFKDRYTMEQSRQNYEVSQVICIESGVLDNSWTQVISLAEDKKLDSELFQTPFAFLEPIHVFALSNILRRPIIIVADSLIRNLSGSTLGQNHFGGIYLPLLVPPENCASRSPILLAYNMYHFTSLVGLDNNKADDSVYAVPLVYSNMEPLSLRFLLHTEENSYTELLRRYLKLTELTLVKSDGIDVILAAKLEFRRNEEFDFVDEYIKTAEDIFKKDKLRTAMRYGDDLQVRDVTKNGELHEDCLAPQLHLRSEEIMRQSTASEKSENLNNRQELLHMKSSLYAEKQVEGGKKNAGHGKGRKNFDAIEMHSTLSELPEPSFLEAGCLFHGCQNRQSRHLASGYCYEHIDNHGSLPFSPKSGPRKTELVTRQQMTNYAPESRSVCKIKDCLLFASSEDKVFCEEHRLLEAAARTPGVTQALTMCPNGCGEIVKDEHVGRCLVCHVDSLLHQKFMTKDSTVENAGQITGLENTDEQRRRTLTKDPTSKSDKLTEITEFVPGGGIGFNKCKTNDCTRVVEGLEKQGYCVECYKNFQEELSTIQSQEKRRDEPVKGTNSRQSPKYIGIPLKENQTPVDYSKTSANSPRSCGATVNHIFAFPANVPAVKPTAHDNHPGDGILETFLKEQASKPSRDIPRLRKHRSASGCLFPGCDLYGDRNLAGYCSRHCKTSAAPNHQVTLSGSKIDPARPADVQIPQPKLDPYKKAMVELESQFSKVKQLCKAGCANLGNSRCKGYCNACFNQIHGQ